MMNEENEISNINSPEPTAPIVPQFSPVSRDNPHVVPYIRRAGERAAGKTADHAAWLAEMEETRQRCAAIAEKRRQAEKKEEVNVVAELDKALEALELGAQDFDKSYGQINEPLVQARSEVDRLRHELTAAESRLSAIEAQGDSVSRLQQSVFLAEGALNGLLSQAESQAMNKLIIERFGWLAPRSKMQKDTLREMALDISVQSLKEFALPQHRDLTRNVEELQKRMDVAGERLTALREHLSQES